MHPGIGRIIGSLSAEFKHFEITCNGQLLDEGRRRDVLGKNLWLYISADSATAAGYNRYRSGRFDALLANVRALCAERRARGDLPRVYLAFIMMRSNVEELSAFLELARDIGADGVKARNLWCHAYISPRKVNRNGFEFDYDAEILAPGELMRHAGKARALARELGLTFFVDFDFGSQPAGPSAPLCSEPWQTMYVLNRGIMPCCFAKEPIAAWSEQGDRSPPWFLREVFNGPRYREIRKALAARTLPEFCRKCKNCPIVRRSAPGA
jgi:MoaA/NifB/PqqE/SkfB family radical SAM enzyme